MTITESTVVQRIRRKLRNTGYQGRRSGKTQSTSNNCGTAQIGDGQSGPPGETVTGTPAASSCGVTPDCHASDAKRRHQLLAPEHRPHPILLTLQRNEDSESRYT